MCVVRLAASQGAHRCAEATGELCFFFFRLAQTVCVCVGGGVFCLRVLEFARAHAHAQETLPRYGKHKKMATNAWSLLWNVEAQRCR
jgi:hypothetical protein